MLEAWYRLDAFSVCFLALGGSVLGVLGLLIRTGRHARLWTSVGYGAALALAGLGWLADGRGYGDSLWAPPLALAAVAACFQMLRSAPLKALVASLLRLLTLPQTQWGALIVVCPALLVAWVSRLEHVAPVLDEALLGEVAQVNASLLRPVETLRLATDAGTPVQALYLPEGETGLTPAKVRELEPKMLALWKLQDKVMRKDLSDLSYNCHGWTFAAGRCWVRGTDVEVILQENGYRQVTDPAANDVVIYRNDKGEVTHSGLVRGAGADGFVLVESKWGWLGRYLHAPEDQCYGQQWTYHRTSRHSHRLRGLGGESAAVQVSATVTR